MDPDDKVEYIVAVNNADTEQTATFETYQPQGSMFKGVWPASHTGDRLTADDEGRITVTVPPLSAVVYRADAKLGGDPRRSRARCSLPRTRLRS